MFILAIFTIKYGGSLITNIVREILNEKPAATNEPIKIQENFQLLLDKEKTILQLKIDELITDKLAEKLDWEKEKAELILETQDTLEIIKEYKEKNAKAEERIRTLENDLKIERERIKSLEKDVMVFK